MLSRCGLFLWNTSTDSVSATMSPAAPSATHFSCGSESIVPMRPSSILLTRLVKIMIIIKRFVLWWRIYDVCISHALITTFRRLAFQRPARCSHHRQLSVHTLLFHIGRRNSTQQGWMSTDHCLVLRQRRSFTRVTKSYFFPVSLSRSSSCFVVKQAPSHRLVQPCPVAIERK